MSFDLMSGRDKLGREISVSTLAHGTKLGRDNCGIKVSSTPGGASNLSRDNSHCQNKLFRLPKLGRDNSWYKKRSLTLKSGLSIYVYIEHL